MSVTSEIDLTMGDDESECAEEHNEEDILSILVATDIHLGYAENDPIRSKDTFETFEEILKIAKEKSVDFVLLGGDLFHDTRPSTYCLHRCTELLKKYCLGDNPVKIEYLSDPSLDFAFTGNSTVNYEDPNLNIDLPVFSIHGNHDDPTGENQISALNLLASTGLVNYFGKYTDYSAVKLDPILLRKGATKLVLYGLSHIKDERLARLFLHKKVTFTRPEEDDWFYLLVLHQNRANRGAKSFIEDESLPSIINLAIWGHEHDCRIEPEQTRNSVHISQPGSTVATSLSQGESIRKQIGHLQIYKQKFLMTPIPLKTVRPFIYKDLLLKQIDVMQEEEGEFDDEPLSPQALTERVVERTLEKMIKDAQELDFNDKLPLLRLNVLYVNEQQTFNAIRFGQKFIDRVANPKDIVKLKSALKRPRTTNTNTDTNFRDDIIIPNRVEDLVEQYFESHPQEQFKCLAMKSLNEAVAKSVDSNSLEAPIEIVNVLTRNLRIRLEQDDVDVNRVDEYLETLRDEEVDETLLDGILNNFGRRRLNDVSMNANSGSEEETETLSVQNATTSRPARGPGSRGGRVRGVRGPRGGRKKAT
ncbi:hypothetical protein ABEB36_008378 [Hypothenemus hampei]|uniref:Double-strand break repair protein n=1 Tax=Hypothenemus hampei TaxID=57062 RepID=A0ABD1ELR3_HYPHA